MPILIPVFCSSGMIGCFVTIVYLRMKLVGNMTEICALVPSSNRQFLTHAEYTHVEYLSPANCAVIQRVADVDMVVGVNDTFTNRVLSSSTDPNGVLSGYNRVVASCTAC